MADSTMLLTAIANIQAALEQMKADLGSYREEIRTNQEKMMVKSDVHY
jgi:hypothetical protein